MHRLNPPTGFALLAGLALLPGRGLVEDVTVIVRDGVIEEVREQAADGELPESRLEMTAGTLLPGLIDSHAHLSFSSGPDPAADVASESDVSLGLRAAYNAQRAIVSGVTTVADCGARGGSVVELRRAIAGGRISGPRIVACGAPITTTAGHCAWLGGRADSAEEVIREARKQVAAGADFLKVMMTGGNITPGSNPAMLQYPPAVIHALAAEARRLGCPLVAHAHSEEALAVAAAAGVTIVAHGTCKSPEGIGLRPETLAALVKAGTVVDPTITVGMQPPENSPARSERQRIRAEMLPIFATMARNGVPLLAGSDAGVPNVRHDSTGRAVLALHEEVGLSLETALHAATSEAARAFGISGLTGSIAPGLSADLVLVNADLRVRPTALLGPDRVWLHGQLMAAEGSLLI